MQTQRTARRGDERVRYWQIRTVIELVKGAAWLVWIIIGGPHGG
ncbi:hypothetical protein [Actinomadura sp. NAK00032]|nr:hypothetical protein [Actinomadura sp. NAK00032]